MNKRFLVGLSVLGLSLGSLAPSVQAAGLPEGYTRSQTPISGKHCYQYGGGHVYYYCYDRPIGTYKSPTTTSGSTTSSPHPSSSGSMMSPGTTHSSPSGSMMSPGTTHSSPSGSMMSPGTMSPGTMSPGTMSPGSMTAPSPSGSMMSPHSSP